MTVRTAVIAGAAQARYEKRPARSALSYLVEATQGAVEASGIDPRRIDGLALTSFQLAPDNVTTFAEHLGLELRWSFQGAFGGAAPVISVVEASRAIRDGVADSVLCVAGDAFDVQRHMDMLDRGFNAAMRDYLAPYGFGGTNGLFALVERRHAYEFGTTREQLAKLAVTQRENARLNPNALLRQPLSVEDYLNARMIADPIRLYDCVMPCGGADAVVVTSSKQGEQLGGPLVEVVAGGVRHNWDPVDAAVLLRGGWADFADEMLRRAGLGHDEIEILELYDDYPIMEVIQLEGLGFCPVGEGGRFVEKTDISRLGTLPINTGGGQLSCGQAGAGGGMIGMTEAVLQLQERAGERQIPAPRTALVSGFGMVGYGRGLSSSAVVLRKEGTRR